MKAAVNKAEMERSESWVTRVPAQDMIYALGAGLSVWLLCLCKASSGSSGPAWLGGCIGLRTIGRNTHVCIPDSKPNM